jgi:hypothetical protein
MITAHNALSTRRRGSSRDGVEAPDTQLRDPQLHIACRRRQGTGPRTVALVGASVGALVGLSTDRSRQLGVDQVLHPPLHQTTEQVSRVGITKPGNKVSNSGIIFTGHRVVSPSVITWS